MSIKRTFIVVCFSVWIGNPVWAASCDAQVKRYERCNPPFTFVDKYMILCKEGMKLTNADRISLMKYIDKELANNNCLSRLYREPRMNRSKRNLERKQQEAYKKQRRASKRAKREQDRAKMQDISKAVKDKKSKKEIDDKDTKKE